MSLPCKLSLASASVTLHFKRNDAVETYRTKSALPVTARSYGLKVRSGYILPESRSTIYIVFFFFTRRESKSTFIQIVFIVLLTVAKSSKTK